MDVVPILTYLLEAAPWAAMAILLAVGHHFYAKNRSAQALNLADRAYGRLKDIEERQDELTGQLRHYENVIRSKEEENAYLRRTLTWTADYVNQLRSHWYQRGEEPPRPIYPAPPEPPSIRREFDRTHH